MSAHRFFTSTVLDWHVGQQVSAPFTAEDLHHAANVLRLAAGETIEVAEVTGARCWALRVDDVSPDAIIGTVRREVAAVALPRVTLVQGIAKGEKMDLIVRQAVEIGCEAVIPVLTERSVVRLDASKRAAKAQRWQRIARSAAEQAHRASIPTVFEPLDFAAFVRSAAEYEHVVVLWEESGPAYIDEVVERWQTVTGSVALVVGPEGGLSAAEVDALAEVGADVATLGPSVLRTETAAAVGSALLINALRRTQSAR